MRLSFTPHLAVLLLMGGAACASDPCGSFSGKSCISLEVRGNPSSLSVTQLLVSAAGVFSLTDAPSPPAPRAHAVSLPVVLAVLTGEHPGAASITVKGLLNDVEIGSGTKDVTVTAGKHQSLTLLLEGENVDLASLPDLAPPIDLAGHDLSQVPCDTTTQSPCLSDQKCVFLSAGKSVCQPAGALAAGALCSGASDQCARSEQCLSPSGKSGGGGVCEQFCGNDPDCKQAPVAVGGTSEPENVGHCQFNINGAGTPRICSVACNPVSMAGPSGCPSGSFCEYTGSATFPEFTFCNATGTAGDGESCAATGTCQAGFSCLAVSTEEHCRAVCRKDTNGDCPATYQCVPGAAGTASLMFGYCCPAAGC